MFRCVLDYVCLHLGWSFMQSFLPAMNLLQACLSTFPQAVLHSFSAWELQAFAFHRRQTSEAAFLLSDLLSLSFFFSAGFT